MKTKIQKLLEKNGFEVEKTPDGWEIAQYTPAGEDWRLYFDKLVDIVPYADNFDEEEEFNMWVEAKRAGVSGVPSHAELWQDQLWKKNTLNDVADVICLKGYKE